MDELDKRYQDGELHSLYGLTVYGIDMWGDPIPIKVYLEEEDNFWYRCEIDGKLKYNNFIISLFRDLQRDYPLVNWDFVHYKDKFVNWV